MTHRTCSVDGCDRPIECKSVCMLHYTRIRRTGSPGPAQALIRASGTGRGSCCVTSCGRPAEAARRMCKLHYGRWLKVGDPGPAEPVSPRRVTTGLCSVDGCGRPIKAVTRRLCPRHYDRWLTTGTAGGLIRDLATTDGTCSLADCNQPICARELCGKHYFARYHDENRDQRREARQRRRALLRNLPGEPYTVADLVARDGTCCVLCGQELDFDARFPKPTSITIEHLECISWVNSAGDVLTNVALAHWQCNLVRGSSPHPAAARKRAELIATP